MGVQRVDYRSGTSQQEIDTQIDQLDGKFQKPECSEEISELARDGDQYSEGLGDVLPGNEKMGRAIPKLFERGGEEKRNDTKEEKRKRIALGSRTRLEWEIYQGNMMSASLENENGARMVVVNGFKPQEDLKMYSQLPDYDDFQGYDLGVGVILREIAHKIYANFHKPSWQTSKHHFYGGNSENFLKRSTMSGGKTIKRKISIAK